MSDMCKCCTCGYEWKRGQNGSHSCVGYMETTIADLEQKLEALKRENDRLRGQLQNCVNHLSRYQRRGYREAQDCIESANKALYETLNN